MSPWAAPDDVPFSAGSPSLALISGFTFSSDDIGIHSGAPEPRVVPLLLRVDSTLPYLLSNVATFIRASSLIVSSLEILVVWSSALVFVIAPFVVRFKVLSFSFNRSGIFRFVFALYLQQRYNGVGFELVLQLFEVITYGWVNYSL